MKSTVLLLLAVCACSLAQAQPAPSAPEETPPEAPRLEAAPLAPQQAVAVEPPGVAPVVVPEAGTEAVPETLSVPAPLPPVVAPPSEPVVVPATGPTPLAHPEPLVAAGRWDGDFQVGFSLSAGSNDSQTFNLGIDTTYTRPDDKLSLSAQYLETSSRSVSNGVVSVSITALQARLGGRYDRDLNAQDFGFVGLEFSHDKIRQLDLRTQLNSGLGRHLVKSRDDSWDVYAGLNYREDYYSDGGVLVNGRLRSHLSVLEPLLGQESTHQLGGTSARLRQKLVLYPSVSRDSGTRATLDAGLLFDLNKVLSLSMKLQSRYDSLAQGDKLDLLFVTGLSVKFGG